MKNIRNLIISFAAIIVFTVVLAMIQAEAGVIGAFAIVAFTKSCTKNVGGNSAVYVTEAANINAVTVTSGEISALTMDSGKTFHEVQTDLDSIIHTQEGAGNSSNIGYTHRVEMGFAKPSTTLNTLRDSLANASPCGILAIVTDGNGTSWLVGYNETDGYNRALRLVQDNMASGAEPNEDDAQRVSIALECINGYLSLPFDSTVGATITGGTATFITYA